MCGGSVSTRVVCLAERAKQTGSRRGADEAPIFLLPEVRPCCPCALVCALHVDIVDEVPVRLLHVLEADIPQNAGIVDEDIDAAKGVDGRLDDGLAILDRVVVGDRLAACRADLVDDFVCSLRGAGQPWPAYVMASLKHVKALYGNMPQRMPILSIATSLVAPWEVLSDEAEMI